MARHKGVHSPQSRSMPCGRYLCKLPMFAEESIIPIPSFVVHCSVFPWPFISISPLMLPHSQPQPLLLLPLLLRMMSKHQTPLPHPYPRPLLLLRCCPRVRHEPIFPQRRIIERCVQRLIRRRRLRLLLLMFRMKRREGFLA